MDQQIPAQPSRRPDRVTEKSLYPGRAAAASAADVAAGRLPPRLIICVGIPGSGKSTFADLLVTAGWVVAKQDSQVAGVCEHVVRKALADGLDVVVDRCNVTRQQKANWVDIGRQRGCAIGCVVFRAPVDICVQRAMCRTPNSARAA
jgi:atypical dual specificity phosphatase